MTTAAYGTLRSSLDCDREVSHHLCRELEAIGRFSVTDYAELIADFRAVSRPARRRFCGDRLRRILPWRIRRPALANDRADAASNGVVYPSVRHAGGTCLAAFRPDLVQNLRQGAIWRLEWQGTATPTVTRQGQ